MKRRNEDILPEPEDFNFVKIQRQCVTVAKNGETDETNFLRASIEISSQKSTIVRSVPGSNFFSDSDILCGVHPAVSGKLLCGLNALNNGFRHRESITIAEMNEQILKMKGKIICYV